MGVLQSSKVAAGMRVLASHFNNLWDDLISNHDHSSGKGGTVDHANLADSGPMSGFTYDHGDIDDHIDATAAHGIPAEGKIVGGNDSYMIVAGVKASPGGGGTAYFSADGASPGVALSTVLTIVLTSGGNSGGTYAHRAICEVSTIDLVNSRFTYAIDVPSGGAMPTSLYFIIVGTIT